METTNDTWVDDYRDGEKLNAWRKEQHDIKKFAQFGMIKVSNHAKKRIKERGFNEKKLLNNLKYNCRIYDEHDNVYCAQCKGITVPIAKVVSENGGVQYTITTAYKNVL